MATPAFGAGRSPAASCAQLSPRNRRRSEPPAETGKTTNRGVSDPPISPVRPFKPRPRRVAHAPRVVSLSDPAATERECLAPASLVRNRRALAFIHREGHNFRHLSLPLARLSGEPRHRDSSRKFRTALPNAAAARTSGDPDHHAVDSGLASALTGASIEPKTGSCVMVRAGPTLTRR
jgi:hypothetical protein